MIKRVNEVGGRGCVWPGDFKFRVKFSLHKVCICQWWTTNLRWSRVLSTTWRKEELDDSNFRVLDTQAVPSGSSISDRLIYYYSDGLSLISWPPLPVANQKQKLGLNCSALLSTWSGDLDEVRNASTKSRFSPTHLRGYFMHRWISEDSTFDPPSRFHLGYSLTHSVTGRLWMEISTQASESLPKGNTCRKDWIPQAFGFFQVGLLLHFLEAIRVSTIMMSIWT